MLLLVLPVVRRLAAMLVRAA
ncbi:hypothetical protein [Pseudoxanthomonas sp. SGNA-20]